MGFIGIGYLRRRIKWIKDHCSWGESFTFFSGKKVTKNLVPQKTRQFIRAFF